MPMHQRDPTAKKLREGKLLKHKAKFLGRDWKNRFVTLYDDSSLVWYEEEEDKTPEGSLHLRSLAPFIIMGKYTNKIGHRRPPLPDGGRVDFLIAVGTGADTDHKIHWFLPTDNDEFMAWVSDISKVLPPAPAASQNKQPRPPPSAPAPDAQDEKSVYPAIPREQQQHPQGQGTVAPYPQPPPPYSQQYPPRPQQVYQYPPAAGYQQPYQTVQAASQPNVIVIQQPHNSRYGYGYGRNYGRLGTGLAVGGLGGLTGGVILGSAMSGRFHPHHHMGGWGCGSGWGHSRHSSDDEGCGDTTIMHNHNIDNTSIINDGACGSNFGSSGWADNWGSNFDSSGGIGGSSDIGGWTGNFGGGGDSGGCDFGGDFGGSSGGDFGGGSGGGCDFGGNFGGGDDGFGD